MAANNEIVVKECVREVFPYNLKYHLRRWSEENKRGEEVDIDTDVDILLFGVYDSDGTEILLLDNADLGGIMATEEDDALFQVVFSGNTKDKAGSYTFEFRAKMIDGAMVHIDSGDFTIEPSNLKDGED